MAILKRTVKRRHFLEGGSGLRRIFEELEAHGIEVRTVRKYRNENTESTFHTGEMTINKIFQLVEHISELRDQINYLESVDTNNYFLDMTVEDLKKENIRLKKIINEINKISEQ